jgi:hypothetical protein
MNDNASFFNTVLPLSGGTLTGTLTATQFLVSGNTSVQGIQIGQDASNSTNSGRLFFTESGGSWAIFNSNDSLSFNNGGTYGSSSGTQRAYLTAAGNLNIDGTFTSGGNATIGGNLVVSGADLDMSSIIRHIGDTDTYFGFPADNQWRFVGGGAEVLRLYQIAGSSGVLQVAGLGSNTYPNFTFNGDTNTGMYSSSADTLSFTAGGQRKLHITGSYTHNHYPIIQGGASAVAGVGVTMADVNGAELGPGYLTLGRDDTADAKQILFSKNGAIHSYLETTSSGLNIGGANVGIGTTSPDQTLTVSSSSAIAAKFLGEGGPHGLVIGGNDAGFGYIGHVSSGSYDLTIDSSGNVGIGTASGDVRGDGVSARTYVSIIGTANRGVLNIGSTASAGADGGKITFVNGTNAVGEIYVDPDSGSQTNGFMAFNTSNSEKMRITSSGNVGINFPSPNHILEANDGALGVTYPISVNNHLAGFNGRGSGIKFKSNTTEQCRIFYYHYGTIPTLFYDGDMHRFRNVASATMLDIGNTGNASLTGSLTQNASDERLKDKVTEIPNAIDKIKELKGVSFEWKGNGAKDFPHEDGKKDIGVIAQDVQKVLPEAVEAAPFDLEKDMEENSDGSFTEKVTSKSGKDYLTVNSEKLIPVLIQGIKEQQEQIETLKQEVEELKGG